MLITYLQVELLSSLVSIPLLMSKLIGTFLLRIFLAKLDTEFIDDMSRSIHSIEAELNPAASIFSNNISLLGPSLQPNDI